MSGLTRFAKDRANLKTPHPHAILQTYKKTDGIGLDLSAAVKFIKEYLHDFNQRNK